MRINKHLISKSTQRQPGDLEEELAALERQRMSKSLAWLIDNIQNAANKIYEFFMNVARNIKETFAPIFKQIIEAFEYAEEEKFRQTTTEQLPELPKLQRFMDDLL
jgi:tyrosyl-tRNA synthetase